MISIFLFIADPDKKLEIPDLYTALYKNSGDIDFIEAEGWPKF